MKRIVLSVFLGFGAIHCMAEDWRQVMAGDEGSAIYVDMTSVTRIGDQVRYWRRVLLPGPASIDGKTYERMEAYTLTDCLRRTNAYLVVHAYNQAGTQVASEETPETGIKPARIWGGTLDEKVMQFVCQRSRPGKDALPQLQKSAPANP